MEGHVVHVRNNYESIDFDFGPTLTSWMERHGKAAYRAIRRGDEVSRADHGGHGNAIAQSYNHSILPLLTPRDRELQIAWGVGDFVYRFGHAPEGIWMPECAVDDDTLEAIADAGLKFTIVGADQGRFSGNNNGDRSAGPFLWRSGGRSVAIFRFDRGLAGEISFGDALQDGARLAERIVEAALGVDPGRAILIATDGETFGHHKKHGAAELARAIMLLNRRDDVIVTNLADYLSTHAPAGSIENVGPSAWSCAHGVERWHSNCGCRSDGATNQEWRRPLFDAMEFVTNHTLATYDRFAPPLVKDTNGALKDSVRIFVDPAAMVAEEFFNRHKVAEERNRETLMRLFEMVRAGQAAMTSCAWFFDDFGGLEGRVALRWAARAVELAAEFAASVEPELLERLRQIRSNRREIGDAATLYLSLKTREARGRI
jgi:alpha-amylase/alpha-mannosidase (GH57 family)